MKVLLVNAPAGAHYRHGYLRQTNALGRLLQPRPQVSRMPSMSLLYLAPPLRQAGHEVSYLEGYFHDDAAILEQVARRRPDVVGLSAYTVSWDRCRGLVQQISRLPGRTWTVVGGVHVTQLMEQALVQCPGLDLVVHGEGEQTFPELVNALRRGQDLGQVPGIVYRPGGRGAPRRTPPRPLLEDLDQLSFPDRGLIDVARYRPSPLFGRWLPHGSIIGARGCPFGCIFCHTRRRVRMRSARDIVDELELLARRHGVRDVSFWDDTFTLDPGRVHQICDEIRRRGIRLAWSVNGRVDTVEPHTLRAMKAAGCWRILWGIESGVQAHLETLKKGITLDQVRRAVAMAREQGLENLGMFVFGIPGETFADGLRTIDFACSLGLDLASFGFLTPYPGTELQRMIEDQDLGTIKPGADHDIMNISFVPHSMTEDQLAALERLAFRRFYFRGGYVLKRALAVRSPADLLGGLRGLLNLAAVR